MGLIMGEALCNGLWLVIDYFTGKVGNTVFITGVIPYSLTALYEWNYQRQLLRLYSGVIPYSLTLREGGPISFAL